MISGIIFPAKARQKLITAKDIFKINYGVNLAG